MKKDRESKIKAMEAAISMLPSSSFIDITSTVLDFARESTESVHGFVGYIDRYSGYLVTPMLTRDIYKECRVDLETPFFKSFDNLFGKCITDAVPIMTNNPLSEKSSVGTPEGHIKIERFIGVPAIRSGKVVGMIGVANPDRDYVKSDLDVLLKLADFYSMVITSKMDNDELIRLSHAVKQVANGVVITDLNGNIQMVNDAFEKITGYTAQEAMGKNPRILKSGFHSDEFYDDMWATIKSGQTWSGRFKNKRKDGSDYWTDSIITPVKDIDGNIMNYMAIKQDVTEKIKAEEALSRSEERLRVITDSAMDAIIMVDRNRKVSFCNPAAESAFGYNKGEIIGKDFLKLVVPDRFKDEFVRIFEVFAKSGKYTLPRQNLEITAHKKNGTEFPMHLSVSSLIFEDNWYAVAIARDITVQHELMKSLKEKREEMESFIYSVSHDLKSPVVTVEGFINILKDDLSVEPGSEVEWSLNRIISATDKMKEMIGELLEYSRLDTRHVEKETVCFSKVVDEALQIFELPIHKKKVKVQLKELETDIVCEKKRFVRVMENLIGNSIKYIGDENTAPEIEIGAKNDGKNNVFYVKDNGIGILEEEKDKVFMLFKRGSNTSGKEGTGVGLAMTRKIIEKHGGRIWFESEVGKGSSFYFTIPGNN